ncbi:hypothetical protein [Microbacterium soli]|uniref:Uncharacterized protein n=1 Tax=Microbacterium soli TaxID=446075 RepID=A0ABP7MZH4_9MICO
MSASDDDFEPVDGTFPEKLAHMLRVIQEQTAALEADRAAHEAAFADAEKKRAEAARAGELGPEWRIVQRRIDTGRTTFADVLSGADTSEEAERLRGMARQNLSRLRASWEESLDDEDEPAARAERAPHLQAQGLAREAQQNYDEIAAQIAQTLRDARRGGQW